VLVNNVKYNKQELKVEVKNGSDHLMSDDTIMAIQSPINSPGVNSNDMTSPTGNLVVNN